MNPYVFVPADFNDPFFQSELNKFKTKTAGRFFTVWEGICTLVNAYETGNLDILKAVYEARPDNAEYVIHAINRIVDNIPLTEKLLDNYEFILNVGKRNEDYFIPIKIYRGEITQLVDDINYLHIGNKIQVYIAMIEMDMGDLLGPKIPDFIYNSLRCMGTPKVLDFLIEKHGAKFNATILNEIIMHGNYDLVKHCYQKYGDIVGRWRLCKYIDDKLTNNKFTNMIKIFHLLFDEIGIKIEIHHMTSCLSNRNWEGFKHLYIMWKRAEGGEGDEEEAMKKITNMAKHYGYYKQLLVLIHSDGPQENKLFGHGI